jgi:hypothetical protein
MTFQITLIYGLERVLLRIEIYIVLTNSDTDFYKTKVHIF